MKNITRNDAISELKTEQSWRRKVYTPIPGMKERFRNAKKQERYDIMKSLIEVLTSMTEAEFNKYFERAERHELERNTPPKELF